MRNVPAALAAVLMFAAPACAADFAQFSFMSGCWKTAPEVTPEYRECYTAPKAGMMQGSSQMIKDGATTSFEFSLVLQEQDKIIYRPFLKGVRAAVDFTLVKQSANEAVFENLAHDFPQRIIYRKADGKLTARIEDATGKKGMQWVMQPQ